MDRLLAKAKGSSDIITVKKDIQSAVYFLAVKRFFDDPNCSAQKLILLALGCATPNAIAVAHLLQASGVACIKKVKTEEKDLMNRLTVQLRISLKIAPSYAMAVQNHQQQQQQTYQS